VQLRIDFRIGGGEAKLAEIFLNKAYSFDYVVLNEKVTACHMADVTLDDPANNFQNILEYGGEEFFEAVMCHYQGKKDSTLLKRTKLRIEARPLFEASFSLLFGFEKRFKERMGYIEAKYG
jgi:hypothetical protein